LLCPLDKDEVHLAESGNIDDVVHTIEARTQKEIQALKADETKPPFSPKTIQDDEHDAQLAAEKVKNAHLAEYPEWAREFGDGEQPAAQKAIAKSIAAELMADKKAVKAEKKADQMVEHDLEAQKSELGEATSPTDMARIKAAEWNEGQALAGALSKPLSAESKAELESLGKYKQHAIAVEQREEQKATLEGKQIDAVGASLNKWYNAHESVKTKKVYELGEENAMTPAQEAIQQAAIAQIKKVEKKAASDIAKAGAGTSEPAHTAGPSLPTSAENKALMQPTTASNGFAAIVGAASKAMDKVGKEAAEDDMAQGNLMMELANMKHNP